MYDFLSSGAFSETFTLKPYASGSLDKFTFAVKDNIDIAQYKTSYGSPSWKEKHSVAFYNALCVEQLLGSGATCLGKTVSDEFTYSLDGENFFFGTPINPKAPERIPGGSSSGSASAVACGLVDFSIGTDSAGSIRVPASLSGVYGMRPTMHRISEAGVLPFVPSTSTVGAFANDIHVLAQVMKTLLKSEEISPEKIHNIYLLEDAFALCDDDVRNTIGEKIRTLLSGTDASITSITLSDIVGESMTLDTLNVSVLRPLQTFEFMNTVGNWLESTVSDKSPFFTMKYETVRHFDRKEVNNSLTLCEKMFNRIKSFIKKGDLIVFPTTPTTAPLKGSLQYMETAIDFYDRTMAITSFSGVGRLPEISIPLAEFDGAPVGLSIAAGFYQDEFLISAVSQLLQKSTVYPEIAP
ncbi:glutamyl-tRNA amidotransferase [Plesiomonas shigelloides]|uniref:amidase family protein n=1 Tax=Plesiomonas shigelloides TaxID=703 RepID=UPI001787723E|nr:amidase family protein [Plesiomonas shigelloides]QOH80950.1 glutamyl-tRNA amidotransferase [Plesiomonas shigelloides]